MCYAPGGIKYIDVQIIKVVLSFFEIYTLCLKNLAVHSFNVLFRYFLNPALV